MQMLQELFFVYFVVEGVIVINRLITDLILCLGVLRSQLILDLDLAYLLAIIIFLGRENLTELILSVFEIVVGLLGSEHHQLDSLDPSPVPSVALSS